MFNSTYENCKNSLLYDSTHHLVFVLFWEKQSCILCMYSSTNSETRWLSNFLFFTFYFFIFNYTLSSTTASLTMWISKDSHFSFEVFSWFAFVFVFVFGFGFSLWSSNIYLTSPEKSSCCLLKNVISQKLWGWWCLELANLSLSKT